MCMMYSTLFLFMAICWATVCSTEAVRANSRPPVQSLVIWSPAKHIDKNIYLEWEKEKLVLADPNEQVNRFFVRSAASEAEIENIFGQVEFVESGLDDEIGFVTETMKESDYATKAAALGEVRQMIRLV